MNGYGARAIVSHHFARPDAIGVYLLDDHGMRVSVAQPAELVFTECEDQFAMLPDRPTLFLPDNHARALLDALSAHYGGTSDTRTLRRDYDAERARVDKMLGAILERQVRSA